MTGSAFGWLHCGLKFWSALMIWLVFGPSGVGKTCFGEWLATKHNWMHLEIDQYPIDGIDSYNLRDTWEVFCSQHGSARPFRQAIQERMEASNAPCCVLTFPGCFVLDQDRVIAASQARIRTIYLSGSEENCRDHFLDRERQNGRNLDRRHWEDNRGDVFDRLRAPTFAPYVIDVFTNTGVRRSHDEVFSALLDR